jgi:hypothetical protein
MTDAPRPQPGATVLVRIDHDGTRSGTWHAGRVIWHDSERDITWAVLTDGADVFVRRSSDLLVCKPENA